jgi:uncharacterized OB-fold protein
MTATPTPNPLAGMRPITDGLFTWPSDEPRLIGSRCNECGTVSFPAQPSCPRCTGTDVTEHLLARDGVLWTWTVQGFRPKSPPYTGPVEFEPYPVGYVELPGEVKVESRLVDVAPAELRIGMPMELAMVPFTPATGEPVVMFAFRPRPAGDPSGEEDGS